LTNFTTKTYTTKMYYLRFVLLAQLRSKNTYNQDSICEATLNITILKQDIFRKCTFITI